jgi:starvation-inducible DNA-binding protein
MQPQIGLEKETRHRVIESLQHLLADEVVLYLKTRNFHWNVEGAQFYQLHKLFEAQYEELDEIMDNVAERIRALGGYAAGSMHEYAKLTRLPEVTGSGHADARMEVLLLRDQETVIQSLRALVDAFGEWGDAGTQDFVTGLMEDHEKMAWMLRSQRSCHDSINMGTSVEAARG